MLTLTGIRAIPSQKFSTVIADGLITFYLYYKPTIKMWMLDMIFNTFSIYSIRVCNSLNLLSQFTELLPFGLMISVGNNFGYEPSLIDDFSSERITLNILDKTEMDQIENGYAELKEAEQYVY